MRKIIAILMNPTVDIIYNIDHFEVGGTYKVKKPLTLPVGKAISFCLALKSLNPNFNSLKLLGFVGRDEFTLYSDFLNKKKVDFDLIPIRGKTRSNKTIVDSIQHTTTHIRELGFEIKNKDIIKFKSKLRKIVKTNDIIILSGSIPPNVDPKIYNEIIMEYKKVGGILTLDTSGLPLINGLKANPFLIKPNLSEFNQIMNNIYEINYDSFKDSVNIKKIIDHAQSLLNDDLQIILITLGKFGAIYVTRGKSYQGFIEVGTVLDTVGCGDSFLAGFIYNYYQKKTLKECFKLALACGTANTLVSGPGIFRKNDVDIFLKKIVIRDLN